MLTSQTALVVADLLHTLAIDNVTLDAVSGTTLVIDELLHALALDGVALTSQTTLAITDLLHGVSIDNLTLALPGGITEEMILQILTGKKIFNGIGWSVYDDTDTLLTDAGGVIWHGGVHGALLWGRQLLLDILTTLRRRQRR